MDKKDAFVPFDEPMDSFFETKLCDLIDLYALKIQTHVQLQIKKILYRDDGLVVIKSENNRELEWIKNKQ